MSNKTTPIPTYEDLHRNIVELSNSPAFKEMRRRVDELHNSPAYQAYERVRRHMEELNHTPAYQRMQRRIEGLVSVSVPSYSPEEQARVAEVLGDIETGHRVIEAYLAKLAKPDKTP